MGYSQGGTTAISAAMEKWGKDDLPGCLIGIDTVPMAFTKANPDNISIPIYSFVGGDDDVYPVDLQKKDYGRLETDGFTLTQWIQPGVHHGPYNQVMNDYAAKWILDVFFPALPEPVPTAADDAALAASQDDEDYGGAATKSVVVQPKEELAVVTHDYQDSAETQDFGAGESLAVKPTSCWACYY